MYNGSRSYGREYWKNFGNVVFYKTEKYAWTAVSYIYD